MLRKISMLIGSLFVAAALVFLTPALSEARGGGGHGGGGFHAGGFHVGGFHTGGYHVGHYGYGGSYYLHPYGGYHHHDLYRSYYGGGYPYYYNGYPYYYGYPSYYGDYYPDYGLSTSGYLDSGSLGTTTDPLNQPSTTAPTPSEAAAHITVTLPANAQLWFNDALMLTTGPVREFDTPPVAQGKQFKYTVKATWKEDNKDVTQTQQVTFTAGQIVQVKFPVPAKTTGQTAPR